MKTIDQYGYHFRIDRERTRAAYEKRPSSGSWLRGALPELSEFLADLGIDVEGELGHIGSAAEGVSQEYTDVKEAVRFVEETNVDALAVMVGTAHGHYRQAPVIATDRIREIAQATATPLVLHGGSGVPDDQMIQAVKAGIRKVNFGTDVCCALLDSIRQVDSKIIAVDVFMKEPVQAVKRFALEKIRLLGAEGSNGQAVAPNDWHRLLRL